MAKQNKKKEDLGGMVYSTNPDYQFESYSDSDTNSIEPSKQNLRVWLERHKGGKVSTVIKDFVGKDSDREELAKKLKIACGVGGGAKEGVIILQGDVRPRLSKELDKLGYRYKLAGG